MAVAVSVSVARPVAVEVAVLVGVSLDNVTLSVVVTVAAATGVAVSSSSSSRLLKIIVVTHNIPLRPKNPIAVSINRKPRLPACRRLCHRLALRPRRNNRSASRNKISPIAKTPAVKVGSKSVNSLSVIIAPSAVASRKICHG